MTSSTARKKSGFMTKPPIEKLKLIALFAVIVAVIYFSHPTLKLLIPGAILTVTGALIRVWAAGHLTRDQRLSTSGPYQHTRNPFYLGRFCVLIGLALMSGLRGNLILWAIFPGAVGYFFFVYMPRKERREGGRLEKLFGQEYELWKSNVPELFPRLKPFVMNPRPWSRELFFGGDTDYTGNKELPTTIVTFLLIACFVVRFVTLLPHR